MCAETNERDKKVELVVAGIGYEPTTKQSVILLTDSKQMLAMPFRLNLLDAISLEETLSRIHSTRPGIIDMVSPLLNELGVKVQNIELESIEGNRCLVSINLASGAGESDQKPFKIASRFSNAIALAARTGAPILMSDSHFQSSAMPMVRQEEGVVLLSDKEVEEDLDFKEFVKNVKASDFRLDLPDETG